MKILKIEFVFFSSFNFKNSIAANVETSYSNFYKNKSNVKSTFWNNSITTKNFLYQLLLVKLLLSNKLNVILNISIKKKKSKFYTNKAPYKNKISQNRFLFSKYKYVLSIKFDNFNQTTNSFKDLKILPSLINFDDNIMFTNYKKLTIKRFLKII